MVWKHKMILDLPGFDKLPIRLHLAWSNIFNEEKNKKPITTNQPVRFLKEES